VRSSQLALALACAAAAIGVGGCHKSSALAELVDKQGPVDREEGDKPWSAVDVGAKFSLGDAARTEDGGARLEITNGPMLAMEPRTTLRFGKGDSNRISVEAGAIVVRVAVPGGDDLTNASNVALDVGDVQVKDGATVRVVATGAGKDEISLAAGAATVTMLDGHVVELSGQGPLELTAGSSVVTAAVDAGVKEPDAGAVAAVDAGSGSAGSDAGSDAVAIEITGRVEVQAPGDKAWKPLAKDVHALAPGAAVRVAGGGTAKLTSRSLVLQLAGGARAKVAADASLAVETGTADASVPLNSSATVGVPGGGVALTGDARSVANARLEVTGHDTKVVSRGGAVKVKGQGGTELALSPGESAALMHAGDRIQPIEAIPKLADFKIAAGETFTVHDPRPPTAIQFQFAGQCKDGGTIELDHDGRFRTAQLSTGTDAANLAVAPGSWAYRLRCTQGGVPGATVASGRVAVMRDDGHRPLPPRQPPNPVDADGRNWRISYQSLIPDIQVHYTGPDGGSLRLHLAQSGKDQTFDGKAVVASGAGRGMIVTVPGTSLHEGTYTYWFDRDGTRDDKVSTLKIEFDQTAPQVYIEAPGNAQPFGSSIDVKGAVLPGWSAAVDGVDLPLDRQRRFAANVQTPTTLALAIRLSHPQRGVHYYLRRAK
jgi:hypothetical protein